MDINILSLFDGISCGQIALNKAKLKIHNYFASEIDKYAIQVTQSNYPNTIQLGTVENINVTNLPKIDLLLGGSPCQSFSKLGLQNGLEGKSGLFHQYVRLLREIKPAHFLFENVPMKKEWRDYISFMLGVEPILINSALFSGQTRNRLYWTNILVDTLPSEGYVSLSSILEEKVEDKYLATQARLNWLNGPSGQQSIRKRYTAIDPEKALCLIARSDGSWNGNYVTQGGKIRKLTPKEYERLQTVPDDYTQCVSNLRRYELLGNAWTVDVIAHLLRRLK